MPQRRASHKLDDWSRRWRRKQLSEIFSEDTSCFQQNANKQRNLNKYFKLLHKTRTMCSMFGIHQNRILSTKFFSLSEIEWAIN